MEQKIQKEFFFQRYRKHFLPLVKNKKNISYFTFTLTLFSLSFFGFFAIRPTLLTAFSLLKNIAELKERNLYYENKIAALIKAQTEYEKIREALPLMEAALPPYSSFNQLAKALENFAQRSDVILEQVHIDNTSISRLPPSGKLEKLGFNLIAEGKYSAISHYLNSLLNWKRIVEIYSLEFSQKEATQEGDLRVAIKGNAYYEP